MKNRLAARPLEIQRSGECARVILPMRSPYLPIPSWLSGLEWFALIAVPIWLVYFSIVRSVLRIVPPPRALFEIDSDTFSMTLHAQESGEKTSLTCKREAIVEFRKNRLEQGLWIHAKGVKMETVLQDIDDATIEAISKAVREILDLPQPQLVLTTDTLQMNHCPD